MAKPLLEQQWDITVVIAEIGDLGVIEPFKLRDATNNAALIAAAVSQVQVLVDDTLKQKALPMPLR